MRYALRITRHVLRFTFHVLRLACCVALLAACRPPGSVRPSVKIGLVAPFEGRYRYVGYDVIYAVRLALREANAAGGVAGYSVELVAYDDGADPAQASEQARKLSADPTVVAAIGHFRDETTRAARSIYAEAGIPLIALAVLDPALTRDEATVYRLGPGAEDVASEALRYLTELEPDRAAPARTALVTVGGPLGAALLERANLQLQPVVSPEETGWLTKIRASGAEAVFCDADPVTAGEVIAALREAEWEGIFLGGPELAAADFLAVARKTAQGTAFVTPYPFPGDMPGSADFAADYAETSNGISPGPLALPAYEAAWVLLEALERDIAAHGEPTREGVAAALAETRREGLMGAITFDAGRNWHDVPLYQYQIGAEGQINLVHGAMPAEIAVGDASHKHRPKILKRYEKSMHTARVNPCPILLVGLRRSFVVVTHKVSTI